MRNDLLAPFARRAVTAAAAVALFAVPASAQQRPMTFMDMQLQRAGGSWTPSPDGQWMLYTIRTPDWQEAESQTDIHVVSMQEGAASSRQLTYTDDKNETQPAWAPDGGSSTSSDGSTRSS